MKILRKYKDSVGIKMVEVAATNPIPVGNFVWVVMEKFYDDDCYTMEGIYTSEETAIQAKAFAINTAPNHHSAYIDKWPIKTQHQGGGLRIWNDS